MAEIKDCDMTAKIIPLDQFMPSLPPALRTERMISAWADWQDHRRAFKKPKSWSKMFARQIEFLSQYQEPVAYEILSQSLRNGYMGLFEPRNKPLQVREPTAYELKLSLDAKEKMATELRNKHAYDGPFGLTWSNEQARQQYRVLRAEIKEITVRLAGAV